jgi:hypothetical protein
LVTKEKSVKDKELKLKQKLLELDSKDKELSEWEASIIAKEALIEQRRVEMTATTPTDIASSVASSSMDVPKEPSLPVNNNRNTPTSNSRANHHAPKTSGMR